MILAGRRLVEDQRRRTQGQGDGEGQPLLLAEREGQRRSIEDVLDRVERRPTQDVGASARRRSRRRDRGSSARTGAPRARSARRASGSDSGRRSRRRSPSPSVVRSVASSPSTKMTPLITGSSFIAVRSAVVLPEPFGPRMATIWRRPRAASTPCRMVRGRWRASTSRNSSRGRSSSAIHVVDGLGAAPHGSGLRRRSPRRARPRRPDHVERQLHRARVGDRQEAVDRTQVARRAVLEVQHPVGTELERLLDAMLDDDDGAALVGHASAGWPAAARRSPGRGWPAARRRRRAAAASSGCRRRRPAGARRRTARHVSRPDRGSMPAVATRGRRCARGSRPARDRGSRARRPAPPRPSRRRSAGPDPAGRCRRSAPGRAAWRSVDRWPSTRTSPVEVARVRVRDQPVDRADERALAAARRTGDEDHLARLDRQGDVPDRGLARAPVAERQPGDIDERGRGVGRDVDRWRGDLGHPVRSARGGRRHRWRGRTAPRPSPG